jgi:hypothetical protein
MSYGVRYNPNWTHRKNDCCYFCGETRSVKYIVNLFNENGERVLTVDACNRCVPLLMMRKDGADNER